MKLQDLSIAQFLRLMWRRRWIVAGATVLALIAGTVASIMLPQETDDAGPMYTANATVRIEQSGVQAAEAAALSHLSRTFSRDMRVHVELAGSEPALQKAVEALRQQPGEQTPAVVGPELDAEVEALREKVSIRQAPGTDDSLQISSEATDPDTARRRVEAVTSAYREYVIEDRRAATDSLIAAMDSGAADSAAAIRLQVLLERAAEVNLVRVSQVVLTGAAELEAALPEDPASPPLPPEVTSDLDVSAARLETVAAALSEIEQGLGRGALSATSTLEATLGLVRDSAGALETASQALADVEPRSGVAAGAEVLESISSPLRDTASDLESLQYHSEIPEADREVIEQAWRQALVVADASGAVQEQAQEELDSGAPTNATRTQVISQLRSGAANLEIAIQSVASVRPGQTDSSVFAQLAQVEGQLRTLANEMIAGADSISAGALAASARVSEAAGLLQQAEAQLTEVLGDGDGPLSIGQVERAKLNAAAAAINDAANRTGQARATSAPLEALNALAPLDAQLAAASSLLAELRTSGVSGDLISAGELDTRIRTSRETAAQTTGSLRALGQELTGVEGESAAIMSSTLDTAASDLISYASTLRARADLLSATAAAVSSPSGARRLSQLASDLHGVAASLDGQTARLRDINRVAFGTPGVLRARTAQELRLMSEASEQTGGLAQDLAPSTPEELRDPPDTSDLRARLRLLQAGLTKAAVDLAQLQNEPGVPLLTERLKASSAEVQSVINGIEGVEAERTNELNGVLQIRKELELATLQPRIPPATNVAERTVDEPPPVDVRVILSAAGGLLLGALAALAIELMDRTVRRPDDMDNLEGLPSLGAIPVGVAKGNPHPPEVIDDPASLFSEAVHQVTTRMEDRIGKRPFVVLVTSPSVREGKTMAAINLARSMALRGRKVLLIDANFRKPDTTMIMGLTGRDGLADALSRRTDPMDCVAHVDNLSVLAAGNISAHPAELVAGPRMAEFIDRASEQFDAIVMDGPPAIGFAEIGSLVSLADSAVLVARSGETHRVALLKAAHTLSEERVLGTALNFARPSDLKALDHGAYTRQDKKREGKRRSGGAIPVGHLRFWRN